ncbi:MAG: FtsQ-type POTRA domain-containing protein [Clostridia bacterium]|nr:FtsQ-type POTRA domain-containing protein [Clostridia bacterium]
MDKKQVNDTGGFGTRRVSGGTRKKTFARRDVSAAKAGSRSEDQNKKRRRRGSGIRAAAVIAAATVFCVVLIFMTPLFNITEVRVEGNNVVELQTIKEKIGDVIGSNLFSLRRRVIENRLLEISQIRGVAVKKKLIPPSLTITIEESRPAAYLLSGGSVIVVDPDLIVIDDSGHYNTDILPSVSGIGVPSYTLNSRLTTDSAEREEILEELLKALEKDKLLDKVTYISVDDLSDIRFNYDNRLEVICGSRLELARKLRMLRESLGSGSISDNSIGTMDLSLPGQAVYTP